MTNQPKTWTRIAGLLGLISASLFLGACDFEASAAHNRPDFGDITVDSGTELEGDLASNDEVVIHEDVVIIDDDPCVFDTVIPEDQEVLTFEFGCDPTGRGIEPGKIVVGTDNGGYLRRIDAIQVDGWTVTAWTSPASIAEAVEQGGLSLSLGTDAARDLIDFSNTILFADTVLGSDVLVRLNRGSFDISPLIDIDGHWAEGEVQRFNFDTDFSVEADFELFINSSNGLRMTKDMTIWETSLPFHTAIGPLPVVGEAGVRAKVGFRAEAPGQASITTGFEGQARWANGRHFRTGEGWSETPDDNMSFEFHEPDLQVSSNATVRAYLRLETYVTFYRSAGPEIQADLYSSVTATPDCEGIDWQADAGLEVLAKIKVNILDKFKPTKIFGVINLTADLAEGTLDYPIGFPLPCAQPEIQCGDVVSGNTALMLGQRDNYNCNIGNYQAPEAVYEWQAESSGTVEWALIDPTPTAVNHDVMVLDGAFGLIFGQCKAWGSNSVSFEATAGRLYYLVVDGYHEDAGPFEAALSCN